MNSLAGTSDGFPPPLGRFTVFRCGRFHGMIHTVQGHPAMVTSLYVYALYDFAYSILRGAGQTNVRCAVYNWEQYSACASEVIDEIGRALGADRSARTLLGG